MCIRDRGSSEGTVLEIKEEKGLGKTMGVIIYNGILNSSDTLVIGAEPEPVVTRVRTLLRPKPLDEIRDPRQQFDSVKQVGAAAGLKVVAPDIEGVVAGAPIISASQDIVMGCYYLTLPQDDRPGEDMKFASTAEVFMALELGRVTRHTRIKLRLSAEKEIRPQPPEDSRPGGLLDTTVGRVLFNDILDPQMAYYNLTMKGPVVEVYKGQLRSSFLRRIP